MKYSSKMAENRVYEIFNSVLKKKNRTSMRLNRAKSYPILKNYNQGSIKKINTFGHKLTLTKSLPALDVAF